MPLPDSFLQELMARNDIEDVVSAYIRLKKRGRGAVGLCPFHGEKTPSFTLYSDTSSFYCFGCGAGGSVIDFIKRAENLDFIDAVKFLADRAGLKIPDAGVNDTVSRLRARVLEANREAARFYNRTLYSPAGREALEYYRGRGYTDNTIKKFGLGYAPPGGFELVNAMRHAGFTDDELTAAFLAGRSRKSPERLYDMFRHRVMIPIIDIRGSVIAFGGRVLDDSKPKYINTSDTVVYKKSVNLFALNFAKTSKAGSLILCEGYMDVIAMHQAGFSNAVAALGTSFTQDHAHLISRYTGEAILIFDADDAGRKGAQRAIEILQTTGVHIRVVSVPDGKDPDEFIRTYGPERFKLLVEGSPNGIEYELADMARHFNLDTPDGKNSYLQKAVKFLAQLNSSIERDLYASRISAATSVNKEAVLDEIKAHMAKQARQNKKGMLSREVRKNEQPTINVNADAAKFPRAARAEELFLGMLLLNPDFIKYAAKQLSPDDVVTGFNRLLYARILERHSQGLITELPMLTQEFDDGGMAYISRMLQIVRDITPGKDQLDEYILVIREEKKQQQSGDVSKLSDDELAKLLDDMQKEKR